jgi:hypothetical protein
VCNRNSVVTEATPACVALNVSGLLEQGVGRAAEFDLHPELYSRERGSQLQPTSLFCSQHSDALSSPPNRKPRRSGAFERWAVLGSNQ